MLDLIERSEKFSIDQLSARQKDRESIHTLLGLITESSSKQEIRVAWLLINDISHNFGGYVGNDQGKQLTQLVNELWQNVLAML